LTRVLCAIATDHGYVQGMNVLLGPLAFVMPELDCYYCMKTLISSHIPGYVLKNLDGVHRGVRVFDQCLQILDGRLYAHIISKIPDLTIFSLRYIMTLMANAQPLEGVLRLWDVLFAFGIHLNVVMLSVHLMTVRDKLMKLTSGFK
jgi:cell cycle arrest protein BUB2